MSVFEDEIALPTFILVRSGTPIECVLGDQELACGFEEEDGDVGMTIFCSRAWLSRIERTDRSDLAAHAKVVQGVVAAAGPTGVNCQKILAREVHLGLGRRLASFVIPVSD